MPEMFCITSHTRHDTTHVTDRPNLSKLLYHVVNELATHRRMHQYDRGSIRWRIYERAQLRIYSELEIATKNDATDTVAS